MEILFSLSNFLTLPFWFLIVLFPFSGLTRRVIHSPWIVAPTAFFYVMLVLPVLPALMTVPVSPSLDAVMELLSTPRGALAAWAHLLAFDLFAGRWAYLDSRRRNITAWLASPALLFIALLGPLGLLLYLGLRTAYSRDGEPGAQTH